MMKKMNTLEKPGRRRSLRQRALLALLEELRQSGRQHDLSFWTQFDRDLKANRFTLRRPANG